jgi:hypothetical protein
MKMMNEPLTVDGQIDKESGVPVITLQYGPNLMFETGSELETRLVSEYQRLSADTTAKSKSVVLDIKADTAGSPVVRALVKMHGFISSANKGQLLVANYPQEFLPALNQLGVTSLPGFRLVRDRSVGIDLARPKVA